MGLVLSPMVVQGAVLGSFSDAKPLDTPTDCDAPNAGATASNNTPTLARTPLIIREGGTASKRGFGP